MSLIVKQAWAFASTITNGPNLSSASQIGTVVAIDGENIGQGVVYLASSTLATTQSFVFESAQASTGPWFTEASTAYALNVSTAFGMRIQGPIGPFVRPRILTASSADYNVLFIGVD